ncbi:MAG: ArsA family ATPase [Bdellovibrionia bacterium]
MPSFSEAIPQALKRNLIFVHGKGGVGKSAVSQAIALRLAEQGHRTLWCTFEDPVKPKGEIIQKTSHLWELNCDFTEAFEEYASMKIGIPALTRIFLQNKLMRYLSQAAPGIHELVLLGKVWFERSHFDHVVVDMQSTGYGLAMFQSTENFIKLFHGGPLNRDAQSMLTTLQDSEQTTHLILSLPEEMPLREALDLNDYLVKLFPQNPAYFFVNRLFPEVQDSSLNIRETPKDWPTPLAHSAREYAKKRTLLESYNLRIWRDLGIEFGRLNWVALGQKEANSSSQALVNQLAEQLKTQGH